MLHMLCTNLRWIEWKNFVLKTGWKHDVSFTSTYQNFGHKLEQNICQCIHAIQFNNGDNQFEFSSQPIIKQLDKLTSSARWMMVVCCRLLVLIWQLTGWGWNWLYCSSELLLGVKFTQKASVGFDIFDFVQRKQIQRQKSVGTTWWSQRCSGVYLHRPW